MCSRVTQGTEAGLRDEAELAPEPGNIKGTQVGAVQSHGASKRVVETKQQLNHCTLAAAAGSHESHRLPSLQVPFIQESTMSALHHDGMESIVLARKEANLNMSI